MTRTELYKLFDLEWLLPATVEPRVTVGIYKGGC
jgi:hypothetical protein